MARPHKIKLPAARKATALAPDAAIDRWDPAVAAKASEDAASISIYDVIGADPWSDTGGVTVKRIDGALRAIGDKDLIVNINSPGGDVFEGIAIYNRLREHRGQVTVKVLGLAASAASIIAMAGDEILIGASSFIMIHNAWVFAIGNRHDMRDVADWLEPFDRALADVYVARTGQKLEDVQAAMDAETWFNGTSAVDKGYADALLSADEIATAEPAKNGVSDQVSAIRKVESALRETMSRSNAIDLINKVKGTSDPAQDGTRDAADVVPAMAGLLETMRAAAKA